MSKAPLKGTQPKVPTPKETVKLPRKSTASTDQTGALPGKNPKKGPDRPTKPRKQSDHPPGLSSTLPPKPKLSSDRPPGLSPTPTPKPKLSSDRPPGLTGSPQPKLSSGQQLARPQPLTKRPSSDHLREPNPTQVAKPRPFSDHVESSRLQPLKKRPSSDRVVNPTVQSQPPKTKVQVGAQRQSAGGATVVAKVPGGTNTPKVVPPEKSRENINSSLPPDIKQKVWPKYQQMPVLKAETIQSVPAKSILKQPNVVSSKVVPAPVITAQEEEVNDDKTFGQVWFNAEFIIIFALWSIEAVIRVFFVWKKKMVEGFVYAPSGVVNTLEPSLTVVSAVAAAMVLVTALVSYLVQDHAYKMWIVIAGLSTQGLSAFLCLLITEYRDIVLSIIVAVLDIGWNAATPARFYLIFHQQFPIEIIHTRVLTSVNLAVVGTAFYIVTIFVTQSYGLLAATYFWAFFSSVVILVSCSVLALLFRHSVFERPTTLTEIYHEYRGTEMDEHFMFRHGALTVTLVVLILLTRVIFSVLSHAITILIYQLQHQDFTFFRYRFDLLLALIAMSTVQLIVHPFKRPREKVKDLYIIGVAHYFNLIAVFILMLQSSSGRPRNIRGVEFVTDQHRITVSVFHPPEWANRLDIDPTTFDSFVVGVQTKKYVKTVLLTVNDVEEFELSGWLMDTSINVPEIVFQYAIPVVKNRNHLFFYCTGETLVPVDWTLTSFDDSGTKWAVINLVESCSTQSVQLMLNEECLTVQFNFEEHDNSNEKVIKTDSFPLPKPYHSTEYYESTGSTRASPFLSSNGKILLKLSDQQLELGSITAFLILRSASSGDLLLGANTWWENEDIPSTTKKPTTKYPNVWKPLPGMRWSLAVSATLIAVGYGIAQAGYIHFAWITCPFKKRLLILAAYFTVDNLVQSFIEILLISVTSTVMHVLIASTSVFLFCHVFLSWFYRKRLSLSNSDDGSRTF